MSLTLVTYGGGEVLSNVFNAIAMLINKQSGGLIYPLMLMTAGIGGFFAICKAFASSAFENLTSKFMFPLLGVSGLLCVPSTTLHIEDVLKNKAYDVAHVPLFLAEFSSLISSVGYHFTVAIEKVMHVPQDASYNKTGMIWGADSALNLERYQISDGDLDQNLRRFCKQCVLYDIALGRYSIDELKKSSDLWKFLADNTSKTRMIQYTPPGQKCCPKQSCLLSCKEAIKQMTPFFNQVKGFYAKQELAKNLPLTFQALTGLQRDSEELVSQQLMMSLLMDEYGGNRFAVERASHQQRSTYNVMGSMAGQSILVMRIVLESLIYAAFIFILPMTLLPQGLRYLTSWAWIAIWLQLWPPFYAVLNYVMQTYAQGQSGAIFEGMANNCLGLSLFTSVGLRNLNADIYAMAGYLSVSIPFITWAIIKGGVNSFVHLAGSLTAPAQAAATSAGAEQATGNYSLANASYGSLSYENASSLQRNFAPSLSSGFISENRGVTSITYGQDETVLRQGSSELRTSLFGEKGTSQAFQSMHQHAASLADTQSKSYGVSLGSHAQQLSDYTGHLSHSQNFGNSITGREGYDISESARNLESMADSFGSTYNLSRNESMSLLMAGGVSGGGGLNLGVVRFGTDVESKLSNNSNASRDDILSAAANVSSSQDFQDSYQKVVGSVSSDTFSKLDDEGKRLAMGVSASQQDVATAQASWQSAYSTVDQLSQFKSASETIGFSERHQLNQEFVNWAQEKFADQGGIEMVNRTLLKGPGSSEVASLVGGFSEFLNDKGFGWPKAHYEHLQNNNASTNPMNEDGAIERQKDRDFAFTKESLKSDYEVARVYDPSSFVLPSNEGEAVKAHQYVALSKVFEKVAEDKILKAEEFGIGSQAIIDGKTQVSVDFDGHMNLVGKEAGKTRDSYSVASIEQATTFEERNEEALTAGSFKTVIRGKIGSPGGVWGKQDGSQLPLTYSSGSDSERWNLIANAPDLSDRWRELP